jgi:HEPN domain-containing protein
MRAALREIETARRHLEAAKHDYRGHRTTAVEELRQAEESIRKGIEKAGEPKVEGVRHLAVVLAILVASGASLAADQDPELKAAQAELKLAQVRSRPPAAPTASSAATPSST